MPCSIFSPPISSPKLSAPPLITTWSSLGAEDLLPLAAHNNFVLYGYAGNKCRRFHGLKLWIFKNFNIRPFCRKYGPENKFRTSKSGAEDQLADFFRIISSHEEHAREASDAKDPVEETHKSVSLSDKSSESMVLVNTSLGRALSDGSSPLLGIHSFDFAIEEGKAPSLCIAIVGASGDLARRKIFPALFALYNSGFLPENVGIFGYSRKSLTDGDLRTLIASTLTCRIDHQENCGSKIEAFLSKTYHVSGGYDNCAGMLKLNARMEQVEGKHAANRIFYLSVPQDAVLNVACCIADKAQTKRGWNRIIIEKPFGLNALSSNTLTQCLLSKFEEKQIYRMDHLLGRNLIENLTVLRNFDGYGVIRDMVHSHILQTIALLAMEPPISLDGEDIRNEKVKVLRSIERLGPSDVILGQYKAQEKDKVDISAIAMTPTYFAAALYINNARWDGVPFMIRAGTGLMKHRMEIRIQFDRVPGNIYGDRLGYNIDLATNELILRDVPDEAILIRVNNKVPGLSLHLDASELNLLYKEKYNVEEPDSYEHLILDVIDGDNHLFMRSDELAAAWNILTPVLQEIDKGHISPELYELGGRGPVGAYYLWAKHGVRWVED
ncbi:hypothetical protein Cgig2_030177 [Carnegiea gigantea]|uniref:Glucose-6-phosphate 1-dehydrogenase n=1 Tax=Carnegiea gigantea TaxID=171969 RepID=A0A9Q1QEK4_9CARY|nr:hypothetical protein Cgig2_030177 [Carnegiea gigantea]